MKLRASAPGKVVLLGEYAVLEGAPALVMAVDRRAAVEIQPSDQPGFLIDAPEVCEQTVRCAFDAANGLYWLEGEPFAARFGLVTGLLRGLIARGSIPATLRCRLRLDTSAFFRNQGGAAAKLGLGSSAALTVALAAALHAYANGGALPARALWLRELLQLHRDFQGGRGSGIDVAASLYGGTLCYQLHPADLCDASVQPVVWPAVLQRLMVWSGQSASTADFLARLAQWRSAEPQLSAPLIQELCSLACRGAAATAAGATAQLLETVLEFGVSLQKLGEAAKIHIFTPEHLRIRGIVEAAGGVYKPCGAGGGDLGMAVVSGVAAARAVREQLEHGGCSLVDLSEDKDGLLIETVS
jgi:phosphomevalonate kinase